MRLSFLLAAGLTCLATAAPSASYDTHVLHEKRDGDPAAWKRHARAFKEQALPIRIGLKQRNLEHANRFVEDVADPESPNYGIICISYIHAS